SGPKLRKVRTRSSLEGRHGAGDRAYGYRAWQGSESSGGPVDRRHDGLRLFGSFRTHGRDHLEWSGRAYAALSWARVSTGRHGFVYNGCIDGLRKIYLLLPQTSCWFRLLRILCGFDSERGTRLADLPFYRPCV